MKDRNDKPWHDNDCFWETFAPVIFSSRILAAAGEDVEQALSLLDLPPRANICDLCCGPGRHSLELARRGFKVTAVDRTAAYLRKARRKARAKGLNIEFIREDARTFCRPDSFDAVINLYTSFGYFEDPEDDKRVLHNINKSLKTGGKLLVDLMSKEVLARIFQERDWQQQGNLILLEERTVRKNWSMIDSRWILLKGGERHEARISVRPYSAVELSNLAGQCGFETLDVFGDLSGAAYDNNAKRLVLLARK